jgi:hypothetical protein
MEARQGNPGLMHLILTERRRRIVKTENKIKEEAGGVTSLGGMTLLGRMTSVCQMPTGTDALQAYSKASTTKSATGQELQDRTRQSRKMREN